MIGTVYSVAPTPASSMPFDPRSSLLSCAYEALRRSVPLDLYDQGEGLAWARSGRAALFVCRHGQLLPALWAMQPYGLSILVSHSSDGELLARILARYGFGLIRGSSSSGGHRAARGAMRALAEGRSLGLAADGPRGPRGCVQEGVLKIARRAGVPIVPLVASGGNPFVLRGSWDRFELPRPFQPIEVRAGQAIWVGPGPDGVCVARAQLAAGLRWADSVADPTPAATQPFYEHS